MGLIGLVAIIYIIYRFKEIWKEQHDHGNFIYESTFLRILTEKRSIHKLARHHYQHFTSIPEETIEAVKHWKSPDLASRGKGTNALIAKYERMGLKR